MIKDRSLWTPVAFIAAFLLFARLRSYADNTGIAIRYSYPIQVDRWLFGGDDPVLWLQSHLGQRGDIGVVDYLLVIVYVSYFVIPLATAMLLWWNRSRSFPLFSMSVIVTFYIGLAVNFLVPTAPPWLAAQHGYMTEFPRLVPKVLNHIVPGIFSAGNNSAGPNDVAAMPSLHIGIVSVVSFYFMTRGRLGRWIGVLYILAMSFALVDLGEHYVTDIAAGILVALASWLVMRWALDRWYRRTEPIHNSPVENESTGSTI